MAHFQIRMRGKLLKAVVLLQATLILLIINLTILTTTRTPSYASNTAQPRTAMPGKAEVSAPNLPVVLGASVVTGDARSPLLAEFIRRYAPNSPFVPYTDTIVSLADKYGIDFRLVPAIAMCESNLGTHIPSHDSFNAWGIAVYTGTQSGKKFDNWDHAFEWVTRFLSERFINRGITDLRDIGAVWAPPSVENGYSWSNCVEKFMDKIQ